MDDFHDPLFQNVLFAGLLQIRAARRLPLDERLAKCIAMKIEGNDEIRRNHPDKAIQIYEQVPCMQAYFTARSRFVLFHDEP